MDIGVPGWLSWLSIRLWLRSWSHGSWVRAPCRALCWQLGGWSLLLILCLPLSLPFPCLNSVSLSVKNKWTLKKFLNDVNIVVNANFETFVGPVHWRGLKLLLVASLFFFRDMNCITFHSLGNARLLSAARSPQDIAVTTHWGKHIRKFLSVGHLHGIS